MNAPKLTAFAAFRRGTRRPAGGRAGFDSPRSRVGELLHLAASFVVGLVLLAGCGGGGVDSGGTGSFAAGPITGFGSIIVGGVHFDDSTALISDDAGNRRGRDELELGVFAEVEGSALTSGANGPTAVAFSIRIGSELIGPIESIDTGTRSVVVIGQRVRVTPATVFDDSLADGLASLAEDAVVEIHALYDAADGSYAATRIEPRSGVGQFKIRGPIASIDTLARTLVIGGQTISYRGVPAGDVPAGLAVGQFVRLRVLPVKQNGVWVTASVRAGAPQLGNRDKVELEGRVSAFTSPTAFSVNGTAVDASAATVQGGRVALGARVKVEGRSVGGTLVATKVKIENENDDQAFQLRGAIETIDPAARTFVLRGVTVDYASNARYDNGREADLAAGRRVEVRGALSADGTRLVARRIKFED